MRRVPAAILACWLAAWAACGTAEVRAETAPAAETGAAAAETTAIPAEKETAADPAETVALTPDTETAETAPPAEAALAEPENTISPTQNGGISLELVPRERTSFTNAMEHQVVFDAKIRNAGKLTVRLYDPEGRQTAFLTKKRKENGQNALRSTSVTVKADQTWEYGLNVVFPKGGRTGSWTVEVTAAAEGLEPAVRTLTVEVSEPRELQMPRLKEVHDMISGWKSGKAVPVEKGKIRYVAQNPKDSLFVKEYWLSKGFDLRGEANGKCTRAVFSMALSYLGIDCTPVGMSDLLRSSELFYTYDQVCGALGNVTRVEGNLETLWDAYQAGEASPVLLHFVYPGGGMHALLLVARDEEDPDLFYAVTSGQRVNTLRFPDGEYRDAVIPLLIEKGEKGAKILSPLLKDYDYGRIDEIWQWKIRGKPLWMRDD